MKKVWLYFENGVYLEAKTFGKDRTRVGEAVFNTSLTGYQEILSDPSYAGQFIVFTMPEIGIVGTNDNDLESLKIHASGAIMRNISLKSSNFRSTSTLEEFLNLHDGFGIYDIDTRYITKMLRDEGAMMMIASTTIKDKDELKKMLENSPKIDEKDFTKIVTTKESYSHKYGHWNQKELKYNIRDNSGKNKIIVIDFGVKKSILNSLCEVGLDVEVISCNFDEEKLIEDFKNRKFDGIFLSNGPGEPLFLKDEAQKISKLIKANIPIFGICLGHQLISIAQGYPTYKLKFGQHGGNHPVYDLINKKVQITAQNHNYNVPKSIEEIATITHYNLFDGTIEGVRYNDYPIFSVQHHPEASPGPHDSKDVFEIFAKSLREN